MGGEFKILLLFSSTREVILIQEKIKSNSFPKKKLGQMNGNFSIPNLTVVNLQANASIANNLLSNVSQNFQLGQLIHATVQSVQGNGLINIQIGSVNLTAKTQGISLQPGQSIQLQVTQVGKTITLNILQTTTPNVSASLLNNAIRSTIPLQQSLSFAFGNLNLINKPATLNSPIPLPQSVIDVSRQLIQSLPSISQVSHGKGLQTALLTSGVFFETNLAANQSTDQRGLSQLFSQDLKANLLQLKHTLQQTPATSSAATDNAKTMRSDKLPSAGTNTSTPTPKQVLPPPVDSGERRPTVATATQTQLPLTSETAAPKSGPSTMINNAHLVNQYSQNGSSQLHLPLRGAQPQSQAAVPASINSNMNTDEAISELLGQINASLSRLQLHQFSNAAPTLQHQPAWLLELPVQAHNRTDLFHIAIQEDTPHSEQEQVVSQHTWSVTMAFNLPNLGPMQVEVKIAQATVSARIWANDPATKKLAEHDLSFLRRSLEEEGIAVGQLDCFQGPSPQQTKPDDPFSLINTKA